jgi:hypothetical protein
MCYNSLCVQAVQLVNAQSAAAACVFLVPLQVLHKRVCEYLELDTRVEVLNTR